MSHSILILEDDDVAAHHLTQLLSKYHCVITQVKTVQSCLDILKETSFQLAFLDYQLPDGEGIDVLRHASAKQIQHSYLMSAFGSISRAVEAVQLGAHDFFEKPLRPYQIQKVFDSCAIYSVPSPKIDPMTCGIIHSTTSSLIKPLTLCSMLGPKDCNVFIHGESGTGKELFARYIHSSGPRKQKSLVEVNCAAIPENLIESELFGYAKGAFTGAFKDTSGKIESAQGGTLFLDEVGDMPFFLQTKLLRVIQEKCILPLGAQKEIPVDFRLICATHKNLKQEVEQGRFREDLYYRLNVIQVKVPPLRERLQDISSLINYWASLSDVVNISPTINFQLQTFCENRQWSGNVRELKNFFDRFVILYESGESPEHIFEQYLNETNKPIVYSLPTNSPKLTRKISDAVILSALEQNCFHRKSTAHQLGISLRNLQYRLAQLNQGNVTAKQRTSPLFNSDVHNF